MGLAAMRHAGIPALRLPIAAQEASGLIRNELTLPLGVAVLSRVYSIAQLLLVTAHGTAPLPLLTSDTSPLAAWDGQWFLSIARNGYHAAGLQQGPNGARLDVAFLPAWPALIRFVSGGVLPQAGVAVVLASVLFCAAVLAIYIALVPTFGRPAALGGVALLAFSPPAFVFSMTYSELLFLLLGGLYFATARKSMRPAIAALAMLTRVAGAAIFAAAAVAFVRTRERWAAVSCGAILLAFLGWWAFTFYLTGSPTAFLSGSDWVKAQGAAALLLAIQRPSPAMVARLVFVAIVGVAALATFRRSPELGAYAAAAVVLGVFGGVVASMPRYAMVAFPAFAMIAWRLGRRWTLVAVVAFAMLQVWFTWLSFEPVPSATP